MVIIAIHMPLSRSVKSHQQYFAYVIIFKYSFIKKQNKTKNKLGIKPSLLQLKLWKKHQLTTYENLPSRQTLTKNCGIYKSTNQKLCYTLKPKLSRLIVFQNNLNLKILVVLVTFQLVTFSQFVYLFPIPGNVFNKKQTFLTIWLYSEEKFV